MYHETDDYRRNQGNSHKVPPAHAQRVYFDHFRHSHYHEMISTNQTICTQTSFSITSTALTNQTHPQTRKVSCTAFLFLFLTRRAINVSFGPSKSLPDDASRVCKPLIKSLSRSFPSFVLTLLVHCSNRTKDVPCGNI